MINNLCQAYKGENKKTVDVSISSIIEIYLVRKAFGNSNGVRLDYLGQIERV